MERERIIEFLGEDWRRVQELICQSLKSDVALLQETNESIYRNFGKQLRPMLSLLMARACPGHRTTPDSIRYAAAAELLHNATLLHDDVTDCSATRRGEPTIWAAMGAGPAVLIGDFWLSKAVGLILDSARRDKVFTYFCNTMSDLAEGEMLQMQKSISVDTTEEDYLRIIHSKTASLFEASITGAAISVDAPDEVVDAAKTYATAMGMAFQIRDDILDYCGKDEMGKPSGVDIREKKITLPLFGAFEKSGKGPEMRSMLKDIDKHPEYIPVLHDFVISNGGIEYASSRLEEYVKSAVEAISSFEDSEEKFYLAQIAKYNTLREI